MAVYRAKTDIAVSRGVYAYRKGDLVPETNAKKLGDKVEEVKPKAPAAKESDKK